MLKTNNPNGRPKTARDGKARRHYATVTASPAEAEVLDAHRGDTPRAEFLRDRALPPTPPPVERGEESA